MPSMTEKPPDLPQLDVLIATLLYLMSRYAQSPNDELAQSISDHLSILEAHPDCGSSVLTKAGSRLKFYWDKESPARFLSRESESHALNSPNNLKVH